MSNLEKEKKFLELSSNQGDKVDISPVGNQSFKLTLPCGCSQVQNGFIGQPKDTNALTGEATKPEAYSRKFQFFEFCNAHKN